MKLDRVIMNQDSITSERVGQVLEGGDHTKMGLVGEAAEADGSKWEEWEEWEEWEVAEAAEANGGQMRGKLMRPAGIR